MAKDLNRLLHWACYDGRRRSVLSLIRRGANIESRTRYGEVGLHRACMNGHTDIAVALVRAGADPLVANNHGQSPLDLARSEELKAALIKERKKYLAWMRRKAFMMFLAGHKYIRMRHHQPGAGDQGQLQREPPVDTVMREVSRTIASFL